MIEKKKKAVLGSHLLAALIGWIVDLWRSRTSNSVFKGKGGWYFWDETWTVADGPHKSRKIAGEAQMTYARNNGLL